MGERCLLTVDFYADWLTSWTSMLIYFCQDISRLMQGASVVVICRRGSHGHRPQVRERATVSVKQSTMVRITRSHSLCSSNRFAGNSALRC